MKKLTTLGLLIVFLGFTIGCGGGPATDSSKATPPIAPEQHTQDIEKAMKEGKIDPATYGQQ